MENNTTHDFIFITKDMVDKMKTGSMKNTYQSHMDCYQNNIGKDHIHNYDGEILIFTDDLVDEYCGLTNNWSEENIVLLNDEKLQIYITICNIDNYFHLQPKHCLYAIRDFMCEFVKAGSLVLLDHNVYRDSNMLEAYINQKYLN